MILPRCTWILDCVFTGLCIGSIKALSRASRARVVREKQPQGRREWRPTRAPHLGPPVRCGQAPRPPVPTRAEAMRPWRLRLPPPGPHLTRHVTASARSPVPARTCGRGSCWASSHRCRCSPARLRCLHCPRFRGSLRSRCCCHQRHCSRLLRSFSDSIMLAEVWWVGCQPASTRADLITLGASGVPFFRSRR
jgi:hypothetical protein